MSATGSPDGLWDTGQRSKRMLGNLQKLQINDANSWILEGTMHKKGRSTDWHVDILNSKYILLNWQ